MKPNNRMLPKHKSEDELEKLLLECSELQKALGSNIDSLLKFFDENNVTRNKNDNYPSKSQERAERQSENSSTVTA